MVPEVLFQMEITKAEDGTCIHQIKHILTGGRIVWDKCNDGSDQSGAEIAYNSMSNKVEIFRFMWRGMMQGKSVMQGTIQ